jgi:hypothetical protein
MIRNVSIITELSSDSWQFRALKKVSFFKERKKSKNPLNIQIKIVHQNFSSIASLLMCKLYI